jgi:hypothetical protein
MKKFCMVLSLAGVMAVPNLFASLSVTLYQDTGNYSYGNGGEFRAVGNSGPSSLDSIVNWSAYSTTTMGTTSGQQYFQTFCTELLEEFSPGSQYTISSIGNNAMYNQNAGPNGIPITLGIAYLYSQFAAGTLGGYDYTYGGGRTVSGGNLQNAIWYMLGEGGSLSGVALTDLNAVTGSGSGDIFATSADWYKASNGAYGVKDMVLLQPGQAQDQLVIVPEATTMLAGALLLLPFGASTLRMLRRNRVA